MTKPKPTTSDGLFKTEEVTSPEKLEEIYRFRVQVWKATGQLMAAAFPDQRWHDAIDDSSRHWVIHHADGWIVATGRLSIHPTLCDVHQAEEYQRYNLEPLGPIAAPDRVVVCPSMQGKGLGHLILDMQDGVARQAGARYAVRQASSQMARLLGRRGWRLIGPASEDNRFAGVQFTVAVLPYTLTSCSATGTPPR